MEKLKEVVKELLTGKPLPDKYKDHPLQCVCRDCRDCHLEPDWVLIYRIAGNELHLIRTGTHADLFRQA